MIIFRATTACCSQRGYPARRQFPLWDVSFDGVDAGAPGAGAVGAEEGRGPAWFWGSVYPQAPWTSCVVPDGPTGGGKRGGGCGGSGGDGSCGGDSGEGGAGGGGGGGPSSDFVAGSDRGGGGGGCERRASAGVYVNVTVPFGLVDVLGARAASVVEVLTGRR